MRRCKPMPLGSTWGKWTIVGGLSFEHQGNTRVEARCACGTLGKPFARNLRSGLSGSCGKCNPAHYSGRKKLTAPTAAAIRVLAAIDAILETGGIVKLVDISMRTGMSENTVAKKVAQLERFELVAKERVPSGKKLRRITSITDKGMAVLDGKASS